MNLYKLHTNPEELLGYKERLAVPMLAFNEATRIQMEVNRTSGPDATLNRRNYKHLEQVISQDAWYSYKYAINVIHGRFSQGEPAILTNPSQSYKYAKDVLRKRWKQAEPLIMKEPKWAVEYAEEFFPNRWPDAEPYIMKDPRSAYQYSKWIMSERWPEAEKYIKQDPKVWSFYKGNWNINESI